MLEQYEATCVGCVIMLDHAHALVWFPESGPLSPCRHSWKRRSSIGLLDWYRQASPNYAADFGEGTRCWESLRPPWQPKYDAFAIYVPKKLAEKLQYIHENPVRAGLVATPTNCMWSSARS